MAGMRTNGGGFVTNRWTGLFVGCLAVLGVQTARAETRMFDNVCTVGEFKVCASVRVSTVIRDGTTFVTMQVWRIGGDPAVIRAFGFYHPSFSEDPDYDVDDLEVTWYDTDGDDKDYGKKWKDSRENDLGGVEAEIWLDTKKRNDKYGLVGCTDPDPDPDRQKKHLRVCAGSYVEFTFELDDEATFPLDDVELRFEAVRLGYDLDGEIHCDTGGAGGATCEPMTAPEPVTALLLGSGLAGVAYLRRRRRM